MKLDFDRSVCVQAVDFASPARKTIGAAGLTGNTSANATNIGFVSVRIPFVGSRSYERPKTALESHDYERHGPQLTSDRQTGRDSFTSSRSCQMIFQDEQERQS